MITSKYEIIKNIVEKISNSNLSGYCKKDNKPLYRVIYYELCRNYLKREYRHRAASEPLGRDHNQSKYALRNFNELKDQSFFKPYLKIYLYSFLELKNTERELNNFITIHTRG